MKRRRRLLRVTQTALMAAIIFVVTYVIRIPLPFASGGYLNIGDTPIYLAAWLLGGPAGAVAGALGAAMSDLAAGYVFYAAPTAAIKGAMGFVCGALMRREMERGGGPAAGGVSAAGGGAAKDSGAAEPDGAAKGPAGKVATGRGDLKRFILAAVVGGAIMVGGYAVFEAFFFNVNQALAAIPFNCIQWAGGVAVAVALFPAARVVERTIER
jgi:uncharacterized membrane protein